MPIKAEIIADSLSPANNRLTTYVLEYPRFVHAELMTHRVFSKNAASSRAIPIEKMIEQVQINPSLPVWWGKNQSGMQANEELDDVTKSEYLSDFGQDDQKMILSNVQGLISGKFIYNLTDREKAKKIWLEARDSAIEYVRKLNTIGLHKQIANRILEPWFHIKIILSGTEFENFFALRVHKDAQPEIRELARQMLELYNASKPKKLKAGEWHIPFGDNMDEAKIESLVEEAVESHPRKGQIGGLGDSIKQDLKKKIAVARCARISYLNFEGKDDYAADIKLCDRLFGSVPRHLSPAEHVAMALADRNVWSGNFQGFKQYRKFFAQENLTDDRVIKHDRLEGYKHIIDDGDCTDHGYFIPKQPLK